jgi:hypothetical protein
MKIWFKNNWFKLLVILLLISVIVLLWSTQVHLSLMNDKLLTIKQTLQSK